MIYFQYVPMRFAQEPRREFKQSEGDLTEWLFLVTKKY